MHIGLGVVDLREGNRQLAYQRFDRALAISTVPIDALYDIADFSLSHGLAKEVTPYARQLVAASTAAIAQDPGRPNFYEYRALAYSVLGNTAMADADRESADSLRGWWQ